MTAHQSHGPRHSSLSGSEVRVGADLQTEDDKSLQLPRRLDSHREFEHRRPVGVERLRERAWERVHGAQRPPSKKISLAAGPDQSTKFSSYFAE